MCRLRNDWIPRRHQAAKSCDMLWRCFEAVWHGALPVILPKDVKKCLMKCGVEDKVQVFLFCFSAAVLPIVVPPGRKSTLRGHLLWSCNWGDTQIVKEDFVEAINNVLNSIQPSVCVKSPKRQRSDVRLFAPFAKPLMSFNFDIQWLRSVWGGDVPNLYANEVPLHLWSVITLTNQHRWQRDQMIPKISKYKLHIVTEYQWQNEMTDIELQDMEAISGACRQLCQTLNQRSMTWDGFWVHCIKRSFQLISQ